MEQQHKAHRNPKSGRKADKKKKTPTQNVVDLIDKGQAKQRNPKVHVLDLYVWFQAFAFKSPKTAEKAFRRNLDRENKQLHVPIFNPAATATSHDLPPYIVAVVGPPKVHHHLIIG